LETAAPYHWVFAVADSGLSTPAVFAALDGRRKSAGLPTAAGAVPAELPSGLVRAFRGGDPRRLADELVNDFEPVALKLRPSLAETREAGLKAGALTGLLSGTGATYAFLADGAEGARAVAEGLSASGTCASVRVTQGPVPGPSIISYY
jgi:4-diphosphocytidyl-2-C-methyl-D-erythritol kinase